MIDQETKNRILDTAQVLDVVSEFVTLRRRGTNYIGLCPFHNERTPSFNVNPARGIFKCFGCGKSGDAARFLMDHEQMTFPEALRWLAHKYGIEIQERELSKEELEAQSRRESLSVVNEYASKWFHNQLNTEEGRAIGLAYLRSRGFRDDIIERFQLGYCPEGQRGTNPFADTALRSGYREDNLVGAGVCYKTEDGRIRDRFHGRVMFPIHSLSGKVVAFSGRVMQKDAKTAKYVNSPESEIYVKSNELYGIWLSKAAIVKYDKCFLVEGNTDVVSLHQAGVENVVASCGTSLTPGQIRKIHRFTNNITVLYDGDSAGIHASLRGIDMLLKEGMNVRVVLLPDGEDPDSFARKHNATELQNFIKEHEVDFITFKTNLLLDEVASDPLRKAELIRDIVQSIAVIPDEITRSTYITMCSQRMNINESVLIREVVRLRKQAYEDLHKQNAQNTQNAQNVQPTPATPTATSATESLEGHSENVSSASSNVQAPSAPPSANVVEMMASGSPLYAKEYLLIREMVRHGEEIIFVDTLPDGSEVSIKVASFVMDELEADDIAFTIPLFRSMAEELMAHLDEPGFKASNFFVRHDNPQVSQFAADLVSERYELSDIYKGEVAVGMADVVPHLINDYKLAILDLDIKQLTAELKKPEVVSDPIRCREVMEQYNMLIANRKVIAKELGRIS